MSVPKYQTVVLINLFLAGFWKISEGFTVSRCGIFSCPVRKYLGLSNPFAVRSKAYVCGRSIAEIAGSNPVMDMDVSLLCLLCVV